MSLVKSLIKVAAIFGDIAKASPEIISVLKSYKEGMKNDKMEFDELLDLFNRLKTAVLKICPELEKYI